MWEVHRIESEKWKADFSENIHKIVFKEIKPGFRDRISYALLCSKDKVPIGYVTVRELDDENVYWQFGGILPKYQKSMTSVKCIEKLMEYQKRHSKRVTAYVENTNLPMLRFFLAYGFLVIGTRTFNNTIMVDLLKELHGN